MVFVVLITLGVLRKLFASPNLLGIFVSESGTQFTPSEIKAFIDTNGICYDTMVVNPYCTYT